MGKSGLSLQNEIKKQVKYDIFDKKTSTSASAKPSDRDCHRIMPLGDAIAASARRNSEWHILQG